MGSKTISRRRFFIESCAGVSSAWLLSNVLDIPFAQEHAHQAALSPTPKELDILPPEQAAEFEEVPAKMTPTDATPLARHTRIIQSIDRTSPSITRGERPSHSKCPD